MYSTLVYLYTQRHDVLLPESTESVFNARWRPVYSKKLKINKGVDNVILLQFYNQDQKPVDISGRLLTFRILDRTGSTILLTTFAEPVVGSHGRARVVIKAAETRALPTQLCGYSLTTGTGEDWSTLQENETLPSFVDDNAGARGVIDVVDSVFPRHTPAMEVSLPTLWPSSGSIYSSEVTKPIGGLTTFQLTLDAFSGIVQAEASVGISNVWYQVGPAEVFDDFSGSIVTHADGYFDKLRLRIQPLAGNVSRIIAR